MYYKKLENNELICQLCPHYCHLKVGQRGLCRGRSNLNGTLIATNYAQCASMGLDPIEKKPLYHYHPGSDILSLGPNSCNLFCSFCQNYGISQKDSPTEEILPDKLVELIKYYTPKILQVAFTYSEPLMWYEYIGDFARKYPEIQIVLVSNGFLNPLPFRELLPFIAALNIDLKAMSDGFYSKQCHASLPPVMENIRLAFEAGKYLEITLLLIESLNDKDADISALAAFIASLSPDIPLHISAYHPAYKLKLTATRQASIERAIQLAKEHLNYVYGGNLPTQDYMQTHCPACNSLVIERSFKGGKSLLADTNKCQNCGHTIYGVFA